jgi:8-oxo-dGTP pyrophosphatase MutT (NUDIX family)
MSSAILIPMQDTPLPKWKTTDSKYLVNDRWLKLRADTCIAPDGQEISPWYVLEYSDWISCLVVSDADEVTLLRHYRHGIDDYVLEILAGMTDKNEDPKDTVRRELEEEIGLTGANIHYTGACYTNPSSHTNKMHCFIALGGTFDGEKIQELGADFQVLTMPLKELIGIIEQQRETMQSLHVASIMFALNYLKYHPRGNSANV